ncbi:MAG: GGDEF domain-containing protein [Cyanobacteria bacterium REEB67]|nr:GGDEF domain-containing protein [Cyanobacteria bacterium REEB67]
MPAENLHSPQTGLDQEIFHYRPLDRILESSRISKSEQNDLLRLPVDALQAGAHTCIQTPIDSLAQIVAPQFLPNVQIIDAPEKVAPLSARWHAQQLGAAAGAALDIVGLEVASRGAINPIAAGAIYDGLLRPVDSGKERDQLCERAKNAAIGLVTFGTLNGFSSHLTAVGSISENAFLKTIGENQIINKTLAGVPAGLVAAGMSGAHSKEDYALGAYTSAFTGLGLGAIHANMARRAEQHAARAQQTMRNEVLSRQLGELQAEVRTDHLTGLGNRLGTDEALKNAFDRAQRTGEPLSLIYGDLDGFKAVNDHLGHAVGDGVLTHVADRMRDHMRPYDYVGRVGGDEFVIVMPNTSQKAAQAMAFRLEQAVKLELVQPTETESVHKIGISLGVVTHKKGEFADLNAEDFKKRADREMYRTKAERKARI